MHFNFDFLIVYSVLMSSYHAPLGVDASNDYKLHF
nr:MAG TPA: hypothetical protein [Caudoviricetes sp.]